MRPRGESVVTAVGKKTHYTRDELHHKLDVHYSEPNFIGLIYTKPLLILKINDRYHYI